MLPELALGSHGDRNLGHILSSRDAAEILVPT